MILHTACPICHTVFKVDEQHLSSAQGMVQCGVCGMVFNAAQHIQPTFHEPSPVALPTSIIDVSLDTHSDSVEQDRNIEIELPVDHDISKLDVSTSTTSDTSYTSDISDPEYTVVTPILFKKQTNRRQNAFNVFSSLLLASFLIFQLCIPYRYQLDASIPTLTPLFDTLCDGHLCSMVPPYDINQIELTNSSFEIDPKNKKFIKVTLVLQNNSNYDLQFPRFLLSLLDNEDTLVSVRKIVPHDYVASAGAFFPARDEHIIKLNLAINDAAVSNYKIRLF